MSYNSKAICHLGRWTIASGIPAVRHRVRSLAPRFGQEEFAVQQAMEGAIGQRQVDGDDAIVNLAGGPAVLVLNSGGLVPLLGATGLVEDADDLRTRWREATRCWSRSRIRRWSHLARLKNCCKVLGAIAGGQGDRLDALSRQVGELPVDINAEMISCPHSQSNRQSVGEIAEFWAEGPGSRRRSWWLAPQKALSQLWQPLEIEVNIPLAL